MFCKHGEPPYDCLDCSRERCAEPDYSDEKAEAVMAAKRAEEARYHGLMKGHKGSKRPANIRRSENRSKNRAARKARQAQRR